MTLPPTLLGRAGAAGGALLKSGVSVLFGVQLASYVIRLGTNLVLTRLLTPDAFGIVGFITSVLVVATLMSDVGFRNFIIRHQRTDADFLNAVWTVRLVRGFALGALVALGAPFIAAAIGRPEFAPAIVFSSLFFVVEGIGSFAYFVAERAQRIRRVLVIEFGASLLGTAILIALVYFERSYWSVLIGSQVSNLLKVIAGYVFLDNVRPALRFDRAILSELWRFSRVILPSSIITIFLTQADKILMLKFFPLSEAGLFYVAASFAVTATQFINMYAARIFYPLASQEERSGGAEAANKMYYPSRRKLFLLIAFGVGGVIGGAELVVRILLDDRFLPSAPYLALLAITPLLRLFSAPAQQFLVARGAVKVELLTSIARAAWVVIAGAAGYAAYGAFGLVAAINLAEIAAVPVCWRMLAVRGVFSWREEGLILFVALVGAGLGAAASTGANALIENGVLPAF